MQTSTHIPRIALTPGEPAGIGPDIVLQLAQQAHSAHIVAFADPAVLEARAAQLGLPIQLAAPQPVSPQTPGVLKVRPVATQAPVTAGKLDAANAAYVLKCLHLACRACLDSDFDALVTGPVHKGIINEAGVTFSGHTEFLAAQTGSNKVVMMLATSKLRVALVTTHLPLKQVSEAITPLHLETVIRILDYDLRQYFQLTSPRILVCGLNPHAGEGGHLGREEIEVIIPVLERLRSAGFNLIGPVPADTAFTPAALANIDVVLTMYHDQGLPVLKAQGFGKAVNITLGLPMARVSVDHGTALELAGSGRASGDSLRQALRIAVEMGR